MGLFRNKEKKDNVALPINSEVQVVDEKEESVDEELIAVITAAIAAFEADAFKQTLHIRKINRTAGVKPAWGTAGLNETIDSRRF